MHSTYSYNTLNWGVAGACQRIRALQGILCLSDDIAHWEALTEARDRLVEYRRKLTALLASDAFRASIDLPLHVRTLS